MWVDSHCNFESDKLKDLVPDLLERAKQAGIVHIVNICSKVDDFPKIVDIANRYPMLSASVGTHPHHADEDTETPVTKDDLVRLAMENKKVTAIGESGLDFYYNHSDAKSQDASFRKHIRAALETGLPLIIHARDADKEIQKVIEEEAPGKNLKGILHCYASGRGLAEWGVEYGLHVSFSGIVTFKNAHDIREIAKEVVPLEKLLIETDAPYLAPVPHRGKINEPSFLLHTAELLAELKGVDVETIRDYTTNNFFELFTRAKAFV